MVKVSITGVQGSAPRRCHSVMIVYGDKGDVRISGSIGGGALEHKAMAKAETLLKADLGAWYRCRDVVVLGADLQQSCGGTVELLYEKLGSLECATYKALLARHSDSYIAVPQASGEAVFWSENAPMHLYSEAIADHFDILYLFGAGHVGRAVAYHLRDLDFRLRWVDFAASRFPCEAESLCEQILVAASPVEIVDRAEAGVYYLVMTHNHLLDFEVVDKILRRDDFGFLGLIGSRAKAVRFRLGLRQRGHSDEALAKLVSPIGIIRTADNAPGPIAVSVVAQLLEAKGGRRI